LYILSIAFVCTFVFVYFVCDIQSSPTDIFHLNESFRLHLFPAKGVRQCMLSDDQNMCMVHCYFLRLFHVCEFRRLFSLAFSRVKAILLDFCLVPTVMLSCMFMAMLQLAVNLVIS